MPRCHGVAQMPQLPAGFVNLMDLIKGARTNPIGARRSFFFPFVYYAIKEEDSLESYYQIKRHLEKERSLSTNRANLTIFHCRVHGNSCRKACKIHPMRLPLIYVRLAKIETVRYWNIGSI